MRLSALTSLLPFCFLSLLITLNARFIEGSEEDGCRLITGRVPIVKQMTLPYNSRTYSVSCTAQVNLNKCEGTCETSVSPSVKQPGGFQRNCRCCKEGWLKMRTVTLTHCYHDGVLLQGLQATTQVSDVESCSCLSCTN